MSFSKAINFYANMLNFEFCSFYPCSGIHSYMDRYTYAQSAVSAHIRAVHSQKLSLYVRLAKKKYSSLFIWNIGSQPLEPIHKVSNCVFESLRIPRCRGFRRYQKITLKVWSRFYRLKVSSLIRIVYPARYVERIKHN